MIDGKTAELSSPLKKVHLDPHRMICSKQGLQGFFWPISPDEYQTLRDVFISSLVKKLRRRLTKQQECDATLILILLFHLTIEMMGTYQATTIRRRAEKQGCNVLFPKYGRLWPFIFTGKPPSYPPLIAELSKGPSVPSRLRLPARYLRSFIIRDGFRRYHRTRNSLTQEIYCISTGPLLEQHAKTSERKANYAGLHHWFYPVEDGEPAKTSVIEDVLESLDEAFKAGNEVLEPWIRDYFLQWITKGTALVRTHLTRLSDKPESLPSHLWTGSGAQIWARILRCAVKKHGGIVTGHDHGIGAGHIEDRTKTIRDFEFCDTFITFTKGQVSSLKQNFYPPYLIQPNRPHIRHIPSSPLPIPSGLQKKGKKQRKNRKRVLYLSQISEGEIVHLMPFMPDPVFLDWVTRVLVRLVETGFETYWKPHPTARIGPSDQFINSHAIRQANKSLRKAAEQADVLLIDNHQTTSFAEIQALPIPIVLIDFGLRPLLPRARSLINSRCQMVSGWFDDNNQAQTNWKSMHSALQNAQTLGSLGFANEYLSTFSA